MPAQPVRNDVGRYGPDGRGSLKVAARVRIPYGLPRKDQVRGPRKRVSFRFGFRCPWPAHERQWRSRHEGIDAPTGSAWELRVYLGADPVNGKQRHPTKTVRAGKREAQRSLNEVIVEAERGLATRTTATVGELLDRWFELAREDFSPKTTREVIGYIERNLRPALGDVRLSKLTTASLDRYYRSLLVDGGRRSSVAPGTIRRIHGILRRALAQGVRWGWLGVNPAVSASPPRVPQPDIAPPRPTQLRRLQAAIDVEDPEFGVFVRLSAMTGARRSEMLALRWSDIDLERGVVTIGRGLVQGPDGLVEKDTKTHQIRRVRHCARCRRVRVRGRRRRFDAVVPGLCLAPVPEGVR